MAKKNKGFLIFLGVIFAIALWGLANLGVYVFYQAPMYDDYCGYAKYPYPIEGEKPVCPAICTTVYEIQDGQCVLDDCYSGCGPDGVNTFDKQSQCEFALTGKDCNTAYNDANIKYTNTTFYIYLIVGLVIALIGLFVANIMFQIMGVGAGSALLIEAVMKNWQNNKVMAFIAGLLVLGILVYVAWKKFGRDD